jgi:hypothetical protein
MSASTPKLFGETTGDLTFRLVSHLAETLYRASLGVPGAYGVAARQTILKDVQGLHTLETVLNFSS